jgi:outer membrane protein TolC
MTPGKSLIAALAAAALLSPAWYAAADTAGNAEKKTVISYADYMGKIREKLPELRKNRLAVEKAGNARLAAGAAGDTKLDAAGSYSRTWRYSNNPFSRTGYENYYDANLGLSRKFTATGTTLSGGVAYSQFRSEIDYDNFNLPDAYHYPSYYLGFSQSLLKNAFGTVDRFARNDAEMKLAIEKLRAENSDKNDLNQYRKLYFSWIEYARRLELLARSIQNAEALHAQVLRRFRAGLSDNDDVQNAAASVLQYRANREDALASYNALLGQLGIFIDTAAAEPDPGEFENHFKSSSSVEYGDVKFEKTRAAGIYRLTKENYRYSREVAGNKLLPQLDITGKYTRKAQDDSLAGAAGKIHDQDYYVGFSVSYPLGNSQSESEARAAELAVEEVNHEYDISGNEYDKNLKSIRSSAEGLKRIIGISEERIRALESKYGTEQKKYLQARLDLNFLIATANTLTAEKINLLGLKKQLIYHHIDYGDLTE